MSLPKGIKPSIPELGKIKIGYKERKQREAHSGAKYQAPIKLDYFIVTTNSRDDSNLLGIDEPVMDALKKEGFADPDGKLRKIPVAVLSDNIDDIVTSRWTLYNGKRCQQSCDGVTHRTHWKGDKRLDKPEEKPCNGQDHTGKGWKLSTVAHFVIATGASRFGGVYKFRSAGIISAKQLHGSLEHVKTLTGGILVGVPLRLVVSPMQVSPDGKPITVHVVHVELHGQDLQQIQQQALAAAQHKAKHAAEMEAAQSRYAGLLQAPGDESTAEQADIAEEFHPTEKRSAFDRLSDSNEPQDAEFELKGEE